MEVILGGTFGPLHDGHRAMLETAFEHGNPTIGLTSDKLSRKTRDEPRYIPSFEKRRVILNHECEKLAVKYDREFDIFELNHPTKKAVETPEFEAIVVSPEGKVEERVREINKVRREHGFSPLETVTAPKVLAEDGERISSTRMIAGEIDEQGNIIDWF